MNQDLIGFSEFFATGEGVSYIFASGTKQSITDFAGTFHSELLTFHSFGEIQQCLKELEHNPNCIDSPSRAEYTSLRTAFILSEHLPAVARIIKMHGYCAFSYKCHFNLA
jgi:hypothetical protein